MAKYVCPICGYVHEGDSAPEFCPQCKCPGSKFKVVEEGTLTFACEHEVGIIAGVDEEIVKGLRMNFDGECCFIRTDCGSKHFFRPYGDGALFG